jgi:hypothetical protein
MKCARNAEIRVSKVAHGRTGDRKVGNPEGQTTGRLGACVVAQFGPRLPSSIGTYINPNPGMEEQNLPSSAGVINR